MTVSLLEILGAARAHAAPLAAESAGYLLLAVADHVVAAPRVVSADEVELMPDGSVRLRARRASAADASIEQTLRRLLGRTLEVASSVGPALRRAAQRTEDAGLPALVRELETALIPVNRSAAKRALTRLHRETERAKSAGKLAALTEGEAPVVASPVVAPSPVVASPVVAPASVVAAPVVALAAEPLALAADYPEPSPPALPLVQSAPLPRVEPALPRPKKAAAPAVELTLTPEPRIAVGEAAFTKPEPVVQRAKERGNATPRLGTLVTLQTLPGEESDRTERVPAVLVDGEPELDLSIDVELDLEPELEAEPAANAAPEPAANAALEPEADTAGPDFDIDPDAVTPAMLAAVSPQPAPLAAAALPQPLIDPEPSRMPDVLTAMLELHTGVDADEAPTRIRDVVTELRVAPAAAVSAANNALTPAPELVDDSWLTTSSLSGVSSAPVLFQSELAAPEVHEALTWNPGPVAPAVASPLPPALVIAEPLPEPSPYAPAVLPSRTSDVSDLLDSFYVSDAAEERDLRSALKGMAGLELTPMPHPYVEEG